MPAITSNVPPEGLSPLASRYVDVADLPWEDSRFPGIRTKTLMAEKESGLHTLLIRMDPGAVLPDHEHVRIEQTYVLEGRLVDAEGEATAGNFVWRPQTSRHTASAPDGCLLLAFFLAPNRFFDDGAEGDDPA